MPSIDLQCCESRLREAFLRGRRAYEQTTPGAVLRVTCTHRSVQEQQTLYAKGRTTPGQVVTQVDGVKVLSKHNILPARAIDFCVTVGGKVTWDQSYYWEAGPYFEAEGLRWGGNFDRDPARKDPWMDLPHVEMA